MRIAKIAIIAGIAEIEKSNPTLTTGSPTPASESGLAGDPGHGDTEKNVLVRAKKGGGPAPDSRALKTCSEKRC